MTVSPYRRIYKQLLPGLLLAGIVLIGLLLLSDINQIGKNMLIFDWSYFALAVALAFLTLTLRFLKRAINLRQSGVQNLSLQQSFRLFVASFPLSLMPTKIGDTFKGIWLFKITGIPVERAISVFLIDQLSDSLSVFFLMIIGTYAYPTMWPIFLMLFIAFLTATILLRLKPRELTPSSVDAKMPFIKLLLPEIRECVVTNPALFKVGNMIITFLIGIISWAVEGLALYFILVGLGLRPSMPLIATSILVFAFSITIGLVSKIPGGIGVIELTMAITLTILMNFQPEIAVTATILFRLATFWISYLLGIIFWSVSSKSLGLNPQEGHVIES